MDLQKRGWTPVFGFTVGSAILALAALLVGGIPSPPGQAGDLTRSSFFKAYEKGDYAAAIKAAPPAVRDLSPYEPGTENRPPYQRDEPVYFDIMAKLSGEKPLPPQGVDDKEFQYYLGVMHYLRNDLEGAKRKFLKCLQLNPSYRMAHVYLFRIFSRWETNVMAESQGKTESIAALLIEKLGVGTSDEHLQSADELLKRDGDKPVPVLRLDLVMDNGRPKNPKFASATSPDPESRGVMNDELDSAGRLRVELLAKGRHCLDETYIPLEKILFWDGRDAAGNPTGGRTVSKTFPVTLELVMMEPAERIVIYDPAGKKVMEFSVSK